MTIVVTGGAGFIGANFVSDWLRHSSEPVVTLDLLTYAGNAGNLPVHDRHALVVGDITDRRLVAQVLATHRPRAVLHFAAESHVDRSITGPSAFIQTNVVGTFEMLDAVRMYLEEGAGSKRTEFRFLHVSTDEVYGSLTRDAPAFTEATAYAPSSPYSASKAASDHLVRAYYHSFGLPVLTTNCSNNYGPFQYPEKLIPVTIRAALSGAPIPVYGNGTNIRDWLYVADHCSALREVLDRGRVGETYNIGGNNEVANIDLVRMICSLLDELAPLASGGSYNDQISFVADRPGHDFRYAIDSSKIMKELGWRPAEQLASGLRKTVRWYLDHDQWMTDSLQRRGQKKAST